MPWSLYDDFQSGVIDPGKWILDPPDPNNPPPSVVTFQGNRVVKFTLNSPQQPRYGSRLRFKRTGIRGVKAKVYLVRGASGDLCARIGCHIGKTPGNDPVWQQIGVILRNQRNQAFVQSQDPANWNRKIRFMTAHFQERSGYTVLRRWITLAYQYTSLLKISYGVEMEGSCVFALPDGALRPLRPGEAFQPDLLIGIRSNDWSNSSPATGMGTVYFDDVWIYR